MNRQEIFDGRRGEILSGLYETVGKSKRISREHAINSVVLGSAFMISVALAAHEYAKQKWGPQTDVFAGLGAISCIGAQGEFYLYHKHRRRIDSARDWIRRIESEQPVLDPGEGDYQ